MIRRRQPGQSHIAMRPHAVDRQLHRQKGRLGMPVSARLRQVFRSNLGATIDLEPFLANVAERRFPEDTKGAVRSLRW